MATMNAIASKHEHPETTTCNVERVDWKTAWDTPPSATQWLHGQAHTHTQSPPTQDINTHGSSLTRAQHDSLPTQDVDTPQLPAHEAYHTYNQ